MTQSGWRDQVRLVGPFQQLVLTALARLGPDTTARRVLKEIEARTGRKLSIQAVHTTLARLAIKGFSYTWARPPRRQRLIAPWLWEHRQPDVSLTFTSARRFHTLRTLGRRALRLTMQAEDLVRAGLPGLGREEVLFRRRQPSLRFTWPKARRRGNEWWRPRPASGRLHGS